MSQPSGSAHIGGRPLRLFLLAAAVLFALATVSAAGWMSGESWFLPAGLLAFTLAFLLP